MNMRPAKSSDLPSILRLCSCSLDLHALAHFTHPYRHLHPDAFQEAMNATPAKKLTESNPNGFNLVIESGDGSGEIVAWAYWRRDAGEEFTKKLHRYQEILSEGVEYGSGERGTLENEGGKPVNPAASKPRMKLSDVCTMKDTLKYFADPHWYLSQLMVDPSHKRKGLGTLLTLWGMRRAKEDGLVAYLTASVEGERLYKRLGWRDIGERGFPKLEDMNEEDRRREEDIFGREVLEEQFRNVRRKVMVWGGLDEDMHVFDQYKELMDRVIA